MNYPYSDIIDTAAVQPVAAAEQALSFLRRYQGSQAVLIAGHLPSLPNIAALLLGCAAPLRMRFDHGSLCRIDLWQPTAGQGELVYHIPAKQMRMLAGQ